MAKPPQPSEPDDSDEEPKEPERTDAQKRADESAKKKEALPEFLEKHFVPDPELPQGETFEMLRRHKAGDREAANDIVRRFQDKLRRYVRIRRKLKRDALNDSMDFVQNAFAKFFKSLEDSDYEYRGKGSLFAYLKGIADFLVLSDGRVPPINQLPNSDEVLNLLHSLADQAHAPEETTTQRELREIMDNAVTELADNFREVILCRYYLSMPAVEVAERMGYSNPQDVHSLYDRAKDAWRKILEPRIKAWLKDD